MTFVSVLAACWLVGLFGMGQGRLSSFQLPIVATAGFLAYWIVGGVRRHVEAGRQRTVASPTITPRTCVIVRQFGRGPESILPDGAGQDASLLERAFSAHPTAYLAPVVQLADYASAERRVANRTQRPRARRTDYIPLTGI